MVNEFINLIFLILFFVLLFSKKKADENSNKFHENDLDLQDSLKLFYTTWNIQSLYFLMHREMQKFPFYEPYLSHAYHDQLKLLKGLQNRCPLSIRITTDRIRKTLGDCKTSGTFQYLKRQFGSLIDNIPELKAEFDRLEHRWKAKTSTQGQQRKHLFQGCQTVGDLKKRFRRLAFLNHPDRGGSAAAMKEVLKQYEEYQKVMKF